MKAIFFLITSLLSIHLFAQSEVYKTYEDYKNNISEKYEGEAKYYGDYRKNELEIKTDGKKQKVWLDDVWGFKYKGILYRKFTKQPGGNIFVGLLSEGKIYYWENAVFIFKKLYKVLPGFDDGYYGETVFLSSTIESPLISKDFRAFFNANKDLLSVAECTANNSSPKINKFLNNYYKLGGIDNIGAFNYFSLYSSKISNPLRRCIKAFNGNFNSQYDLEK